MTILSESERLNATYWYEKGWSFQEIGEQILADRNSKIYFDVIREVTRVLTGIIEIKKRVPCPALKDMHEKRLAYRVLSSLEEYGGDAKHDSSLR